MDHPSSQPEQTPSDTCREAIRLLEAAIGRPPGRLTAQVDLAEREIARLRDKLIDRARQRRRTEGGSLASDSVLEQVNIALSLVVGVEYPVGGIERHLLDQARTVLQRVLATGLGEN